MGEEEGESIIPILFLLIAFFTVNFNTKTNKQRSYWRTPRTKTVSAVPADVLLLYLKCRTEENFHWLQDWMRHFPLQTPLTLVSIAERPRLWGTLIHPSRHCQCGRLGGQNCRACSGTPLPCSLHVTVQSTRKTSCVGLLASLPDFFCKISSKRTSYRESPLQCLAIIPLQRQGFPWSLWAFL